MWYGACVLSVSMHDNKQPSDALWEEQLFLVEALHEEDVRDRVG